MAAATPRWHRHLLPQARLCFLSCLAGIFVTGSVVIHTAGSNFDTLLAVYMGSTVSTLTVLAANDQDQLDPLGGDTSRVKLNVTFDT
ncbi:MAG TPA: hypothetical protein VJS65_06195, partial [Verrucomicrobiae bacterium]|nr:hypothetical protein [Verrucomicrobiae bacterium]